MKAKELFKDLAVSREANIRLIKEIIRQTKNEKFILSFNPTPFKYYKTKVGFTKIYEN